MTKRNEWEEIKRGYGLEEIPQELRREFSCLECGSLDTGRQKLYTDQNLRYSSRAELEIMLERVSSSCWCKYHAIWWFKE